MYSGCNFYALLFLLFELFTVHVLFSLSKIGKGKGGGWSEKKGRVGVNNKRKKEEQPPVGNCCRTVVAKRLISHAGRIQTIL